MKIQNVEAHAEGHHNRAVRAFPVLVAVGVTLEKMGLLPRARRLQIVYKSVTAHYKAPQVSVRDSD
ncbi:MAG: hypothetical protein HOH77_03005 [Candidatus Latescibacteria bacterium]|nr:hypothetical protein [Candidatus Latescibacterota bacterium]